MDHKNSEEAALVRRVQARDEMAFREIVERYQAKVFSGSAVRPDVMSSSRSSIHFFSGPSSARTVM